jgi:hypothetical protein
MFISCVFVGSGLCNKLITHSGECYWVCDPETSTVGGGEGGAIAPKKMAERSGYGVIDLLFLYLPGGSEELTETCSKDVQMLQLRFD